MAGIAHLAFGFAAKPLKPKVPLAVWLIGSELIDLVWIASYLLGLKDWSHTLLMSAVWSIILGGIIGGIGRDWKAGLLGFGVGISHWILDAVVWPMTYVFPDRQNAIMTFLPGNPAGIGLGLYRHPAAVYATELGFTLIGAMVYVFFLVRRRRAAQSEKATGVPGY